jgi:hypothetical protein
LLIDLVQAGVASDQLDTQNDRKYREHHEDSGSSPHAPMAQPVVMVHNRLLVI